MRKRNGSNFSSEQRNWEKIFNGLVQMLRTQQKQLQSLVDERKFLEDRIRMQHDGWASDIRLYKDQITEIRSVLIFEEKKRSLEGAKAELVLGSKHREASTIKWILEHTQDELADFKAWFECLSRNSPKGDGQGTTSENADKRKKGTTAGEDSSIWKMAQEEKCLKKFRGELRRLKEEYEKLASEKSSEVSALLAEKKFVWNQYNIMENDYVYKLKSKQCEVEQANQKIEVLVSGMEQLQSSNAEKDDTISQLESKVAYMETDTKRLKAEISKLSVELESLRKSKHTQVTPVLNRCTAESKTSGVGDRKGSRSRSNINLKKEIVAPSAPDSAKYSEKGKRSLKRKESPVIPVSETPKLFSSNFKVPKLKNSSPSVR